MSILNKKLPKGILVSNFGSGPTVKNIVKDIFTELYVPYIDVCCGEDLPNDNDVLVFSTGRNKWVSATQSGNTNIYNGDGSLIYNRTISLNTFDLDFINGSTSFRRGTFPRIASTLARVVDITQTSGEFALHLGRASSTSNVAANQVFYKSASNDPSILTTTPVGHFLGNLSFYGINGNSLGVEAGRLLAKVSDQTATTLDATFVFSTGALYGSGTSALTVNGKTGGVLVGRGASASVEAAEVPSSHISFFGVNKGQMMPPMTTVQRLAIPSPANGIRVYDTDFNADMIYNSVDAIWTGFRYNVGTTKFQGYNGSAWIDLN